MDEVTMSLPNCSLSGSPVDVRTIALPPKIARKAIPPEILKTILNILATKRPGSVDKQPKTV